MGSASQVWSDARIRLPIEGIGRWLVRTSASTWCPPPSLRRSPRTGISLPARDWCALLPGDIVVAGEASGEVRAASVVTKPDWRLSLRIEQRVVMA